MKKSALILVVVMSLFLTVSYATIRTAYAESHTRHSNESSVEERELKEHDGDSTNAFGYVEPHIDKKHLMHRNTLTKSREAIPSSYSLVEKGLVTPVKDQNPYGTCWTFATVGSAESSIKRKYNKTVDLAELQLAYFFYNSYQKADPLNMITNDGNILIDPYDSALDLGGNSLYTTLALSSGIGFSNESEYPYYDASDYVEYGTTKACYNTDYRLRASIWMNMSEPDRIKKALMEYGALDVSYFHDDDYFNETTSSYYQVDYDYSNHAVTLVGWDDNYSRNNFNSDCRPENDGAWLLKNSWGTWWGNEGYFWISYEDASLYNSMAAYFDTEMGDDVPKKYNLYQYDGSGNYEWYTFYDSTVYTSNVYKVISDGEILSDVGFICGQAETSYTISIYTNVIDDPTSGQLVYEQSGILNDAGYYLIELNEKIGLTKDDKFAVIIAQSSDETVDIYVDKYYEEEWYYIGEEENIYGLYMYNDVSNDISYYSTDGNIWYSLVEDGETARIKAVTVKESVSLQEIALTLENGGTKSGVLVSWTPINNADEYEIQRKVSGEKIWTVVSTTEDTNYTDSEANIMGTKYLYKVLAYKNGELIGESEEAEIKRNPFSDIDSGSKTFTYAAWAFNAGIVGGTSETTFSPKNGCTRAQFALMLYRMVGKPSVNGLSCPFEDISGLTSSNRKAVIWAYNEGIVGGTSATTYSPEKNITRAQIVLMLYRLAGKPSVSGLSCPFKDISGLSANNKKAVIWAYNEGIVGGTSSTTFSPNNNCTRLQLVTMLYKYNKVYKLVP